MDKFQNLNLLLIGYFMQTEHVVYIEDGGSFLILGTHAVPMVI